MAIAPITVGDTTARAKMNAAIAEANKVSAKADAATVTAALASESAARRADILALPLPMQVQHRPGDAALDFGQSLPEGEVLAEPLPPALLRHDENGRVARVTGDGIVAPRHLYALEPGRRYLATFAVQRRVNSPDPDNDAIRCALAWYGQGKGRLSTTPHTVAQDLTGLTTGSGRQVVRAVVARAGGADIDIVAPTGARYVRPYVQTFGTLVQNDVEVINWTDITDAVSFAPDVSAIQDQVDSILSLDLGDRTSELESQVTAPNEFRVATFGDLEAADVPVSADAVLLLGAYGAGDRAAHRRISVGDGDAAVGDRQSLDGRWWRLAEPLVFFEMFGGLTGSANATSNDAAMARALSWLAAKGGDLHFLAGEYYFTEGFAVPDGSALVGAGGGAYFSFQTSLIFVGTGAKVHSIPGATAKVLANPRAGEAYLADSGTRGNNYSTLDLTEDFSAAIVLGWGSGLKNLGVYPNLDGVAGYALSDGAMSDEWDVGVYCRNAERWRLDNAAVAGHWREAAVLLSNVDLSDGRTPTCQAGQATHCFFQGFRGVALRSSETNAGDMWGFAGTDFVNCDIRPLQHQSQHLATSSALDEPFDSPSACLELSGYYVRGVQFTNCTFIGRDDICMIFDQAREIVFIGCYEEAQNTKVSGGWLTNGQGATMVGTSSSANILFKQNTKYAVDFTPYQGRDVGLNTGRYTAAGVFNPTQAEDDDYSEQHFASWLGPRLRSPNQGFRVLDENNDTPFSVDHSGSAVAKRFGSGVVTIADDAVGSIVPPKVGGMIAITFTGGAENSNFPSAAHSGLVFFDTGASSFTAAKFAGGASFAAVNTDVTGTTGVDGQVTVGVVSGAVKIENRQGASSAFRYVFLA